MRVLITGGSGFIGSHLTEYLQDSASEIRILDNLRSGNRANLDGLSHTFIHGSITDPDIVEEAVHGVDYIFHLAALVSVPESVQSPYQTVDINVRGLLNILESATKHAAKKVVLASSAAIYGENPTVPKTEDMLPEPKSPYAITKLDGEYYLNLYQQSGKLDTCSLRFFNVFGPRQDPNGPYAAAIPAFIEKALLNEPITIFGDGEQTRDFVFVKDIVSALAFAAIHPISGTYNVGYGKQMTLNELIAEILLATNSSSQIIHAPDRPGDVKHSRASVDKLLSTGWKPSHNISHGLVETLSFFRGKLRVQ